VSSHVNDVDANKVNSVISQLQDIQNEIYKSKNTPITFACIPPVCISKYRDYNYHRQVWMDTIIKPS
jgi:queuine/archaeosine tRNA-ribosyltransferase